MSAVTGIPHTLSLSERVAPSPQLGVLQFWKHYNGILHAALAAMRERHALLCNIMAQHQAHSVRQSSSGSPGRDLWDHVPGHVFCCSVFTLSQQHQHSKPTVQVAGVTGDLRRALELCRKAAEIAEREGAPSVRLPHVDGAVRVMFGAAHMQLLRTAGVLDKILLAALLMETKSTGARCTLAFHACLVSWLCTSTF